MKTIVLSLCALSAATLGVFAQASKVESTTKVIAEEPPKTSPEVGISARDGITISGVDLMMTRNGVTEKVTKELELENGTRVQPNGTVTTAAGAKIVLRPAQILTFDGRLLDIPHHTGNRNHDDNDDNDRRSRSTSRTCAGKDGIGCRRR